MHKILVTGANGFVGKVVVRHLVARKETVRVAIRNPEATTLNERVEVQKIDFIDGETDWGPALSGITQVIHLASHVHSPHAKSDIFMRVNVEGTERLARMAAAAGVTRFIYVSSIKAQGEVTGDAPMRESDTPRPRDAYGRSKLAAERALMCIAGETGMQFSIIRPPLVYGRQARGNLVRLMALLARGLPLPLAGLNNRRSFVDVETLADLCCRCLDHPAAINEIFLAADAAPMSTTDLLQAMSVGLGVPARLFTIPQGALRLVARLLSLQDEAERLLGSLDVDASKVQRLLGWQPAPSSRQGIIDMACDYAARRQGTT